MSVPRLFFRFGAVETNGSQKVVIDASAGRRREGCIVAFRDERVLRKDARDACPGI